MGVRNIIDGAVHAELKSADVSGFLSDVSGRGVQLREIEYVDELTVRFVVARRDYGIVDLIADKRADTIVIRKRTGLYWTAKGLRRRPVLLCGVIFLIFLTAYLPTRVLFVSVTGNRVLATRQILEKASGCGVYFGASREDVRSEKVKNRLLAEIPELQWAGVNTYGCVAVIAVQEKNLDNGPEPALNFGNVVAVTDGVVTDISILRGSACCQVGQAVRSGQILISGYVDYGICVRATGANGEILAQTSRALQLRTPTKASVRSKKTDVKKRYSVLLGKNLINLYKDSGISDRNCVRMYTESRIVLPGGFQLPVAIVTETVEYYTYDTVSCNEESAYAWLAYSAEEYLLQQMLAGKILTSNVFLNMYDDHCDLYGAYRCSENIGRIHYEEIGIENDERS